MVQKLYHHACKKVSVIDKGESTVSFEMLYCVINVSVANYIF